MSSIKGRFGNDDNCLRGEPGVLADALLDFSMTKAVERPILNRVVKLGVEDGRKFFFRLNRMHDTCSSF